MERRADIDDESPSEISKEISAFSGRWELPMLPVLCALALSFGLCGSFEYLRAYSKFFLFVGLAFFAASFWARFSFDRWRFFGVENFSPSENKILKFSQIILPFFAVFFCAFAYYFFVIPENPMPCASVSELELQMEIREISRGANNSRYGIAKVMRASPQNFSSLEGSKIWFSVSSDKDSGENKNLEVSQEIFARGTLYPSDFETEYPLPKNSNKAESKIKAREKGRAFGDYLKTLKIHFRFSTGSDDIEEIRPAKTSSKFFSAALSYMKDSLSAFPKDSLKDTLAAKTYRAMILGDKSELSDEQKDDFARTGTMHVFAISGMHVGFAAAVLYFIPLALRIRKTWAALFVLPPLFIYVCACGARPSAMRAFFMIAFVWLAVICVRGMGVYAALLLSAVLALLYNPTLICDAGFVLSYGVVLAILVYGIPLYGFVFTKTSPFKNIPEQYLSLWERLVIFLQKFITASLGIGFAAALACAPLSSHFFSYIAPTSPLYSPIFSLGAACAVGLGFLGFMLPDFLAQFLNCAAASVVWLMSESARLGATYLDSSIDFKMQNGFLSAAIFVAFIASAACLKNIRLKLALPPLVVFALLLAAMFYS